MNRFLIALKAFRQLGYKQSSLFAIYQLGLRTGYYRWVFNRGDAKSKSLNNSAYKIEKLFPIPSRDSLENCLYRQDIAKICPQADEIVRGKYSLFGGNIVDLELVPSLPVSCWTAYETGKVTITGDIKMIWEPARFGWAYILARAYAFSSDEKYVQSFWRMTEMFLAANPAYLGPHWTSAQEVALRLIGLVFASQVFADAKSTTSNAMLNLGKAIVEHAQRIPPTLIYARAQNNNHLLSEAAGLITAALALPQHPKAEYWARLGWYWFNRSLEEQIDRDGAYIQQSANYHRLMLQLALWIDCISRNRPENADTGNGNHIRIRISDVNLKRLSSAAGWLLALADNETGRLPNLGPNDGAYIQPLSPCTFEDYRPVIQAASVAFSKRPVFDHGPWDEMSIWYGLDLSQENVQTITPGDINLSTEIKTPHVMHNMASNSRAYLRVARFNARPGHADQLHLDLWWRGMNIARDAGTYHYNAPPPWSNSLARTTVHNTITIDGADQMTRGGKFLWLDWAQAKVLHYELDKDGQLRQVVAHHDGYRKFGIIHHRAVQAVEDGSWMVYDRLDFSYPSKRSDLANTFRLHWLLCDTDWTLEGEKIILNTQKGFVVFEINSSQPDSQIQCVREGKLLSGKGEISPTWGWASPTYASKEPALSFSVTCKALPPVEITTRISFSEHLYISDSENLENLVK